jgi:hypothetical protein
MMSRYSGLRCASAASSIHLGFVAKLFILSNLSNLSNLLSPVPAFQMKRCSVACTYGRPCWRCLLLLLLLLLQRQRQQMIRRCCRFVI